MPRRPLRIAADTCRTIVEDEVAVVVAPVVMVYGVPVEALRFTLALRFLSADVLMPMLNRWRRISPGIWPHSPPGLPVKGRLNAPSVLFSFLPLE